MYRRNDTPAESYQHLLLKLSKEHYRKMVRKTYQKDRRDIDEFGNEIKTDEEEED
jgi:ribosome-associated heat shock protein Hsp15